MDVPTIIKGGLAVDDRGELSFINDFNFKGVKRFYQVINFSTDIIRAFHGHLKEAKYVFVSQGSFLINCVSLDELGKPKKDSEVHRFVLTSKKPAVLFVPRGYANGFKALEKKSKILFFSTSNLDESKDDDFRFVWDYFGKEIWEVKNR